MTTNENSDLSENDIAEAMLGDGGEFFATDFAPHPADSFHDQEPSEYDFCPETLDPEAPEDGEGFDKTLAHCCRLDQSDTDNGKRLIEYFGKNILVMQAAGIAGGDFLTWSGRHWD